ncbi:DUF2226 domain-containing protein [Methanocaldococcus fervens]|uniref:Uncharacterized protein n=1 Tax=Methanocaldococcus fervens (strain DSM 4213 / JCM 15782 / AG86) TaxID=573064 RepID=C7P649_METFA|nr:DUF2226 domain-containing protein [Methanocaldococcus fervens]ACV24031.1 Protein of unknown function DUF2226 [Methanocaldococcus fervens AG86]
MIKIIEGELIETLNDGKIDDTIKELENGYILILVKDNNTLHEGYVFVEDGKIVGYFYTDNKSTEIFGNAEKVLELLNHENKVIEVYKYDKDKLNLMKWLYPEMFAIEKDEKKDKKEIKKEDIKYLDIKLNIPLDVPIATDVKDFKEYLKDDKYIIVNAYRKNPEGYENAYIVYKGKNPIAAACECNYGVLLGKDACKKIEQMLNDKNSVVDVYEYDEMKLNVLLDLYPEMKIEEEKESEKEVYNEMGEIDKEEEIEISREELLKRLGLKEPDEEWVEAVLEDLFRPGDEEINELKRKIENEIIENVKNIDGVEDVKPNIEIKWENGRYFILGDVNIKRKRIFGIIKKDVDPSIIKFEIDRILKNNILNYTSDISINIE